MVANSYTYLELTVSARLSFSAALHFSALTACKSRKVLYKLLLLKTEVTATTLKYFLSFLMHKLSTILLVEVANSYNYLG